MQSIGRDDVDSLNIRIVFYLMVVVVVVAIFIGYGITVLPVLNFTWGATNHSGYFGSGALFHCSGDSIGIAAQAHNGHF